MHQGVRSRAGSPHHPQSVRKSSCEAGRPRGLRRAPRIAYCKPRGLSEERPPAPTLDIPRGVTLFPARAAAPSPASPATRTAPPAPARCAPCRRPPPPPPRSAGGGAGRPPRQVGGPRVGLGGLGQVWAKEERQPGPPRSRGELGVLGNVSATVQGSQEPPKDSKVCLPGRTCGTQRTDDGTPSSAWHFHITVED